MILITGASGLLGTHLISELLKNGYPPHQLRLLIRTADRKVRIQDVLQYYHPEKAGEWFAQLEFQLGDICDLIDLEDAMLGCEKVIHCAALVSFHRRDFSSLFEINRRGTANVVNTALKMNIKHLVHISSTAAIGSDSLNQEIIRRETNRWNANEKVSGYSLSKYSAEKEVWRGMEEGLSAVIVNPSLLVGAGNWNESSLQILRTLSGGLKFYTSGANAFVDVRDVAHVIYRLLETNQSGERYLVAGHNLAFKDFFDTVCNQLDTKPPSILAGKFAVSLAWRLSRFTERFTGIRPTITKESARSSMQSTSFSNEKIKTLFPDFEFTPLSDTIANAVKGRLK